MNVNGVGVNDDFVLRAYEMYERIKKGNYNLDPEKARKEKYRNRINNAFITDLKQLFLLTDNLGFVGNNILKFATQNNPIEDRIRVFHEFARGASLIYFGNMEIINMALDILMGDVVNE